MRTISSLFLALGGLATLSLGEKHDSVGRGVDGWVGWWQEKGYIHPSIQKVWAPSKVGMS